MAGTNEDLPDVEDISGKNTLHAEEISDGKSMQQLVREKNYLFLGDPSTVVRMGKTGVFWDAVAYPFPSYLTPDAIYGKIESALRDCYEDGDEDWDYMGEKSIWVYVDEKGPWGGDFLKKKTWTSRIYFLPGGDKSGRRNRMLHDIHLWGMDFPVIHPRPSSLVLVSDQVRGDLFFRRMLKYFRIRGFHVFLATQPKSYEPEEEEVKWPASLLAVLYSFDEEEDVRLTQPHNIRRIKATPDGKDVADKCLHIEDFSAVVEGGQLGVIWYSLPRENKDFYCYERPIMVFWNVTQCPIPSSEKLPCVIDNIESAIHEMGFHSPVIIYAYAYGDTPDQRDAFKKARICYAVGDEHLRSLPVAKTEDYGEMAVDLISFATPTYEKPAILVVIANPDADSELIRVLKCLKSRNHDVLLVKQSVDGSDLFDSAKSIVKNTQGLVEGEHISRPTCRCDSFR